MIAIFKRSYTVKFIDEDNIQSGQFTFVEGKGYQCELNKQKLVIWDFDKVLNVRFNKKQIDKYLGSIV